MARGQSSEAAEQRETKTTGPRLGLGRGARGTAQGTAGRFAGKGSRANRADRSSDLDDAVVDKVPAGSRQPGGSTAAASDGLQAGAQDPALTAGFAAPAYVQSNRVTAFDDRTFDDAVADFDQPDKRPRPKKAAPRHKAELSTYVVAPTVGPAKLRKRHYGVLLLFLLMVIVPTGTYAWYLWARATDQFESDVGFASRTEQTASPFDFLGVISGGGSSGAKDMDILNQFIVSQELVTRIDRKLDLRHIYSKPQNDPLMAFDPKGSVEDLVKYWQRMVLINYDTSTGLMNLRVFAFDAADAQHIAEAVLVESTDIINNLSLTAQTDSTKYSKQALDTAEDRLGKARIALTNFRVANHIVDPSNDIASQMTVVTTLTQQLAAAEIDLDMLTGTVADNDPRLAQLNRKIDVIRSRISVEQAKFGAVSDSSAAGYATLVSDYERLQVDQDFAEKAYLATLAAYDTAVADAQHNTRYLATYISPTLAEETTAPNRPLQTALAALAAFLLWSVLVLVYYALRDRR